MVALLRLAVSSLFTPCAPYLWCLCLGLKAGVCEGQGAVIAEQADEGSKGHGLHPVVDLGDPVPCQRPGACGALHVGEAHSGLQGQGTQDGLA